MTRTTACARAAGVMLSMGLGVTSALGQACEPGWGEGFANAPGFNGEVRAIALFDDGSGTMLYAGGHFTSAGGQTAHGIARWEEDHWAPVGGGVDPITVGSGGAGGGVYWLGVLDVGSGPALYTGGVFSTAGGSSAVGVARWNGRAWSKMGSGLNNQVRAMTVFDDGNGPAIYAAGTFDKSGQTTVRGLAKWNGSAWSQVGGGLQQVPAGYGYGYSLGVFDLGQGPRLYVGGRFALPSVTPGQYWNNIAAWDGTSWSGVGPGVYGSSALVMKMVMFDHGAGPQLTIGGSFNLSTSYVLRPRVARWTGSQWIQVGSDLSGDSSNYVNSMVVLPGAAGPTLHIGGWFSGASWLNAVNYVARLGNGDWLGLDGGMSQGIGSSQTRCMLGTEEARVPVIYASGGFQVAGDAIASRVAKWDGARWHGLEASFGLTQSNGLGSMPARGLAACAFDDGSGERIFIGGQFVGAGNRVSNSIGAWDGQTWHPVGEGVTRDGAPGQVHALTPFDDGSGLALYAAGDFDHAGGGPSFGVARWDGAGWSAPGGNGLWRSNGTAWQAGDGYALASFDDGSGPALYVGGQFDYAGATPAASIARWNGTAWSGLGTGGGVPPTYTVEALQVFDEGAGPRLFVGGGFTSIAGVRALAIARWDGVNWSDVGGGFAPATPTTMAVISDLAVLDDGSGPTLVAGGRSGWVGPAGAFLLAKWNGLTWQRVGTNVGVAPLGGVVERVWSFDDGAGPALYIGGTLHVSGHNPPVGWLRLRAGAWELPGGGVSYPAVPSNAAVLGAAVRHDGDHEVLLLTGMFTHAGEALSAGVAEWRGCPVCYADCDRDGSASAADFGCFQGKFVGGDPWADCNGSGALTVADFGCFQTKFVAGCP